MAGLIEESDRRERLAKSFGAALFECLLEAWELIPVVCLALLCLIPVYFVGVVVHDLMFDPNAVDVTSRLEMISIDPDKWFPRS